MFRLTNVIKERIIFVSRGITAFVTSRAKSVSEFLLYSCVTVTEHQQRGATRTLRFAVSVTSNLKAGVIISMGVKFQCHVPISLTLLSWTAVITLLPSPSSLRHLRSAEERVQTKGKCYWLQEQPSTAASASFHFWVNWTDAGLISSFIGLNNFWRVQIRINLLAIQSYFG